MASFRNKVFPGTKIVAAEEAVGKEVLIAWEFSPNTFKRYFNIVNSILKKNGIETDLCHMQKPVGREQDQSARQKKLWGSKGNDWSHVSVGMLSDFQIEDEKVLVEMAKKHKPTWTPDSLLFWPTDFDGNKNPHHAYVVLKLDYPNEAKAFDAEWKAYAGVRVPKSKNPNYSYTPHASLLTIKIEDLEKAKKLLQNVKIKKEAVPSEAIQIWLGFQVVDHFAV